MNKVFQSKGAFFKALASVFAVWVVVAFWSQVADAQTKDRVNSDSITEDEVFDMFINHIDNFDTGFFLKSPKEKAKWITECHGLLKIFSMVNDSDLESWANRIIFDRENYTEIFWQYLTNNIMQSVLLNRETNEYVIFVHYFPYEYTEKFNPDDKYCVIDWDLDSEDEESH